MMKDLLRIAVGLRDNAKSMNYTASDLRFKLIENGQTEIASKVDKVEADLESIVLQLIEISNSVTERQPQKSRFSKMMDLKI
jgi:hypothetical protein